MTTPLPDTYLSEIEARLNAATPGPWRTGSHRRFLHAIGRKIGASRSFNQIALCSNDVDILCGRHHVGSDQNKSDAAFIAHAPADIAALLAEVRRLRAETDNLESALQDAEQRADTAYTHGYNVAKHGGYRI